MIWIFLAGKFDTNEKHWGEIDVLCCQLGYVVATPREMNHFYGSVAFFGAFKTNPSVCSGNAIPANPAGISYCQAFMYLIDIKGS